MIRVLLVDDDALVRSGLRIMLAGAANLDVVAEAADGREVLGAVDLHRPDVVLMDIRMPAARDSSRRAARSARVGWGGCVRLSPPSSRRTPITPRSSSSAVFALSRITPAASATSSAGASG